GRHDCAFSAGANSGQRFTAAARVSAAVRKESQADNENSSSPLDRTLSVLDHQFETIIRLKPPPNGGSRGFRFSPTETIS
ncbi:MAG: hypothetical protein OXC26_16020, partial [Albidovulum sp.]|nr:hypothetical protein [Albidovulum sp.]